MAQKFANAARAYLSAGISDVATTVTITSGGALFPEITGSDFSRAVLQDEAGIEIVLVTAHTAASNSFTVTRGQEGTTARAFSSGAVFGLRMTAADGDTFVAKVDGPASATANAVALFDGATGKLLKDSATLLPAGDIVGTTATQTLTNKRVTPRVVSIADAATITPTGDTADEYIVTALAQPATIAAPSGTPANGQKLILRIKDDGTGRALTWTTTSGAYRAVGVTLPTTTTASKVTYVGCLYNSQDTFWDVVAVATQA